MQTNSKERFFEMDEMDICDIDNEENSNKNVLCFCDGESNNIANDCKGCLKCTNLDCAYYIQKIIETFMQIPQVVIYAKK